jgi:pseudouridine 5'-phosphatase
MDGLLLNTEDIINACLNQILAAHNRPPLPWSIKAQIQGRPRKEANAIFFQWAALPISEVDFDAQYRALQLDLFRESRALPGVEKLLEDLGRSRVHMALATSTGTQLFHAKTNHLSSLFASFPHERRVLGDDSRIGPGRGKPLPDIYHVALQCINDTLPVGETEITPEECLVFEDSVSGVEAGRRAGMRVVWCPHEMIKREYAGREDDVLAGRMGNLGGGREDGCVGQVDDGWSEYCQTLEGFDCARYGIIVPS